MIKKTPVTSNQKNVAPSPANVEAKNPTNTRPSRETPKATDNKTPTVVTPQKNSAPAAATPAKPQQNSRNRRDTVQKSNQQPVTWNKDDKTKATPSAPSVPVTADRKTRETPKETPKTKSPVPLPTDNTRKTRETPKDTSSKNDKTKSPAPVPTDNRKTRETQKNTPTNNDKAKSPAATQPDVAKVPLTSTNSRNRRDAPNPVEQSKLVPSGSIAGNIQSPSLQARKDPIQTPSATLSQLNHKRDTQQGSSIRYPVPVDQVLKQKTTDDKPTAAASVADNSKPAENSSKKV
jgi:hypothetical protein